MLRSFFHFCHILFLRLFSTHCSSILPHLICHLFLGLLLNLVVSKFIYNTFWGIFFSSILCTCPYQCILK
jgi:hypothetical protein